MQISHQEPRVSSGKQLQYAQLWDLASGSATLPYETTPLLRSDLCSFLAASTCNTNRLE